MEDLFATNLIVDNENVRYRVIFKDDCYTFLTDAGSSAFSSFSFKRENDEWHGQEKLPPDLKKQAIDALEEYLLQQH